MSGVSVVWLEDEGATLFRLAPGGGEVVGERLDEQQLLARARADAGSSRLWRLVVDSRQEEWSHHPLPGVRRRDQRSALAALVQGLHPPPALHHTMPTAGERWRIAALEGKCLIERIGAVAATGIGLEVTSPLLSAGQLADWLDGGRRWWRRRGGHRGARLLLWRRQRCGWRLALTASGSHLPVSAGRQVDRDLAGDELTGFIDESGAYWMRQGVVDGSLPAVERIGMAVGDQLPGDGLIRERDGWRRGSGWCGDQLMVLMLLELPVRHRYLGCGGTPLICRPLLPLLLALLACGWSAYRLDQRAEWEESRLGVVIALGSDAAPLLQQADPLMAARVAAAEALLADRRRPPWSIVTPLPMLGQALAGDPSIHRHLRLRQLGWEAEGEGWWVVMVWELREAQGALGDAVWRRLVRVLEPLTDGRIELLPPERPSATDWRVELMLGDPGGWPSGGAI